MLPIQVVAHAYLGPLEGLDGLRYSREEDMGCSGCPPLLPPPLDRGRATALWLDLEDPELADAAFAVRMALSVLRRVVTAWGGGLEGRGGEV